MVFYFTHVNVLAYKKLICPVRFIDSGWPEWSEKNKIRLIKLITITFQSLIRVNSWTRFSSGARSSFGWQLFTRNQPSPTTMTTKILNSWLEVGINLNVLWYYVQIIMGTATGWVLTLYIQIVFYQIKLLLVNWFWKPRPFTVIVKQI